MRVLFRRAFVVLALGLAFVVLLHTPPVKRAAGRFLISLLEGRLGGTASLQAIDYRLWRAELEIEGFEWRSPDVQGIYVKARELNLRISPRGAVDVRALEPFLQVTLSNSSGGEPPVIPAALLAARLTISNGVVWVEWPAEGTTLQLSAIEGSVAPEGARARAAIDAAAGSVVRGETRIDFGPARARALLGATDVQVDEVRVEKEGSWVTASGTLGPLSPLSAEVRFEHSIEDTLASQIDSRIELGEALTGSGFFRRRPDEPDAGEGVARTGAISFETFGPFGVEGSWRWLGGSASAEVSLEGAAPGPVASQVIGRMSLSIDDFDPQAARGDGLLSLRGASGSREGVPLSGDIALKLESRRIAFSTRRLTVPGAALAGSGTLGETFEARFRAQVEDVARLSALGAPAPPVHVRGPLELEGTVSGTPSSPSIEARFASDGISIGEETFALTGTTRYRGSRIEVEELTLRGPGESSVVVNGGFPATTGGGELDLSARIESIPLAGVLDTFSSGTFSATVEASGDVSSPSYGASFEASELSREDGFRGDVRGTASGQGLAGRAEILVENAFFGERELPGARVSIDSNGDTALLSGVLHDGGEILTARVELRAPYPLEAEVPLENLPFDRVREIFPQLAEAGMELEVRGRARLETPLEDIEELAYRIDVEGILGVYRGIALGATSPFVLEGNRDGFTVRELTLIGEDTAIGIDGVIPLSRDGSVVLHARGATRLELLRPWFPDFEPAGRANVNIRVEGALPDPWLRGELSLEDASVRVGAVPIENVEALVNWSDRAVVLEELEGEILGGSFRVSGELPPTLLDPSAPVRLRFEAADLQPLKLVSSEGELHADVEGEIRGSGADFESWEGSGTIRAARFAMRGFEMANEAPGPWSFEKGKLLLSDFRMTRGETRLALGGEVSVGEPFAWTAEVKGRIDHAISRIFLEELGLDFTGATDLDVRAEKTGEGPLELSGRGTFANARLVMRDPPITFSNVSGEIALSGSSVSLTRLSADAGGGKLEANGTLTLDGIAIANVDLGARARSVRLNYPEGLRSELDGTLRLQGNPDRLRLTGDANLARALLSRDISVESELLQSLSRVGGARPSSSFASKVDLELRVRAPEAFRIDNNLARMESSVNLTVGGTLASPELDGIVSVRPGGRFRFGGNEYRVESGRILLRGYPASPPELNIDARTSVGEYDIRLVLRGETDNLSTDLTSQSHPQLSRGDVASLLITGRTLGEISSGSRDIVSNRMVSYLGSTLGDLAKLGIGEALPFEILTVAPSLIAGEADPGARFTIGARFNNSLSLVYSIGLDDTETQIWIVDYELPYRTRTQVVRDVDNEYTFGLAQEIRFDVRDRGRAGAAKESISDVFVTFEDSVAGAPEDEVRGALRLKPGETFDYWEVWEKAEEARKILRSRKYLEAIAEVATSRRDNGRVEVDYRVRIGPRVSFAFPEDEPGGSLKEALENAWTGDASDSFLTTDLANLATRRLYQDGYFSATAELTTERSGEELLVKVFLQRGPRGNNVAVEFEGNEAVPDSSLLQALPKPRSGAFHDLLTTKRSRLKQIVVLQYAAQGFVSASVGEPDIAYDGQSKTLRVTIPVTEGPRHFLRKIELQGVSPEDEAEIRAKLSLREGLPFRVQSLAEDRTAIASFYRDRGYLDVEVEASLSEPSGADELDVLFAVTPGTRITVAEVVVEGNRVTREGVIRREIQFEPGGPLSGSALRETERGLYELGVFQSAEAVVDPPSDGSEVGDTSSRAVRIGVVETQDLELNYGGRASTDGFFEVLTELRAPNLFGRAQHASVRALVGSERKIFRFSYNSPYFARYKLDTNFFVERSIEHQGTEPFDFTDRIWTFTAQQTRSLTEKIDVQWSYTFRRLLTEFSEDFEGLSRKRSIITGSLIGDHRDNMLIPRRGGLWLLTTQLAPEVLGSDLRYTKIFGQFFLYVPLHEEIVWASGYRIGAANSFGQRLDENDGFRAGGPNSVRGFEQDSLGPSDVVGPMGGGGVAVFNQEIRFPLWWRFRGVGFYDAGNAFETPSDISLSDLRQNIGAGLRFELPFGLIRLDWARIINPLPGEKPWRLLFSLGDAF
jgi:outer membrane protein assembly complex protein YaeT